MEKLGLVGIRHLDGQLDIGLQGNLHHNSIGQLDPVLCKGSLDLDAL